MPSSPNRSRTMRSLLALASLAISLVQACAAVRPEIKDPPPPGRLVQWGQEQNDLQVAIVTRILDRAKRECDEYAAGRLKEPPVLNVLSLSGGGDKGAFGSGFLNGWAQVADPAFARPQFDVVTGVSTGSLIAPFAFVGTAQSYETIETLYRNPKKDWVRDRGLFFFLPDNESLMTIGGLKKSLDEAVSPELVGSIADQAALGRNLIISATNEDLGVPQVFDIGQAAGASVRAKSNERILKMLLASSALPAAFPPVEIDGMLYGDGGVTANVLLRLDLRSPRGFLAIWRERYPGIPLPRLRYWVIFNNQIQTPPETVQPKWLAMAGRSLEISVRSSTMAQINLLAAEIEDMNDSGAGNGELWLTAIPNDWRPPVAGTFQKETMNSLADIGRRMGADPKSWTLMTPHSKPQ